MRSLGKYRSKLDMIADILSVVVVNNGARKTQIMYDANLSFKVLERYLAKMVRVSLITFEKEVRLYLLTSKGKDFLVAYHEYSKIKKRLDKRLKDIHLKEKALKEMCWLK